jgi:hypothetical protein
VQESDSIEGAQAIRCNNRLTTYQETGEECSKRGFYSDQGQREMGIGCHIYPDQEGMVVSSGNYGYLLPDDCGPLSTGFLKNTFCDKTTDNWPEIIARSRGENFNLPIHLNIS